MPKKPAPAQRIPFVMPDPLPTRLLMLATHDGSHDGSRIATYRAGEVYAADTQPPMSAHLARIFLRAGWAVDADADIPNPMAAPQGRQAGPSEQPSASPSEAKQDAPAPSQSDAGSPTAGVAEPPALSEPVESQIEDANTSEQQPE